MGPHNEHIMLKYLETRRVEQMQLAGLGPVRLAAPVRNTRRQRARVILAAGVVAAAALAAALYLGMVVL